MKMKVRTPYEAPEAEALVVVIETAFVLDSNAQITPVGQDEYDYL